MYAYTNSEIHGAIDIYVIQRTSMACKQIRVKLMFLIKMFLGYCRNVVIIWHSVNEPQRDQICLTNYVYNHVAWI